MLVLPQAPSTGKAVSTNSWQLFIILNMHVVIQKEVMVAWIHTFDNHLLVGSTSLRGKKLIKLPVWELATKTG